MVVVTYNVMDRDGGCMIETIACESKLVVINNVTHLKMQGGLVEVLSVRPIEVETEEDIYREMQEMGLSYA